MVQMLLIMVQTKGLRGGGASVSFPTYGRLPYHRTPSNYLLARTFAFIAYLTAMMCPVPAVFPVVTMARMTAPSAVTDLNSVVSLA